MFNVTISDIICLVLVYIYVIAVFLISEKLLSNRPNLSRKFVHIMVGNMIFIMPFFSSTNVMIWFITLPVTVALFFLTEYSPIKIKNTVTESGHALGLLFYAAVWTALLFIFPSKSQTWIVALGIAALVYGDGFASLIGAKFGKLKYNLTGDEKTIEGSLTMFIVVTVMSVFVWMFYQTFYASIGLSPMPQFNLLGIFVISAIATICEAITPRGADNISVPGITALCYFLLAFL